MEHALPDAAGEVDVAVVVLHAAAAGDCDDGEVGDTAAAGPVAHGLLHQPRGPDPAAPRARRLLLRQGLCGRRELRQRAEPAAGKLQDRRDQRVLAAFLTGIETWYGYVYMESERNHAQRETAVHRSLSTSVAQRDQPGLAALGKVLHFAGVPAVTNHTA